MIVLVRDDLETILEEYGFDDWTVVDDATLMCPHGHAIEPDGHCPDGCESPLLTLRLI